MLKNYFVIAFRNIIRNKLFSIINILGLAVGIACSFLIILDVQDDLSYDQFIKDKDDIYRVVLDRIYPENIVSYAIIPHSYAHVFVSDIPEVEESTRIVNAGGEFIVTIDDKSFKERHACAVDSNFFDFFDIPVVQGDPEKALAIPNGILLSETIANKYFGKEDPLGKTLSAAGNELVVAGVFENIPENSHMKFDLIFNVQVFGLDQRPNYIAFSAYTYIKLIRGSDPQIVEEKFPGIVKNYAAGQIGTQLGVSFEEYTAAGNGYHYYLQPLTSIYLTSHLESEIRANGNRTYVFILAGIALFLVIIAGINFMNLSTARSADRAKEVGMRKVVGSQKNQLVLQFLTESILITLIGLIIAVILVELLLPSFNILSGKELSIHYFDNFFTLPLLLCLGILIGILAGSYPAFVLSAYKPGLVLKGKFSSSGKGAFLRNSLVVFQFWISILLISITLLILKQMHFLKNTDMGFAKENIVLVERARVLEAQVEAFKTELLKNPKILAVATSSTEISGGFYPGVFFQTKSQNSEVLTSRGMAVDYDFFHTMNLKILEGRGFSKDFYDSLSMVINESAVREFKLENPIGAVLHIPADGDRPDFEMKVIGVVKDFHYNSLHTDIKSFVIWSLDGPVQPFSDILSIKIENEAKIESLSFIEEKWNEFLPEQPFSYKYLDDDIFEMYKSEEISSRIFGIFTILTILIACIGLFGLAAYTASKRTKEIGIRKVMGASIPGIVSLLSSDFAKLVIIAFILAVPVAWIFMKKWLLNFAYQTNISAWIFLLAGASALFVALFTISVHAMKAASANPAESLKYE